MPKSLTNYYQESGRAGRDGLDAECIMYFNSADRFRNETMIEKSFGERDKTNKSREHMLLSKQNLDKCYEFW